MRRRRRRRSGGSVRGQAVVLRAGVRGRGVGAQAAGLPTDGLAVLCAKLPGMRAQEGFHPCGMMTSPVESPTCFALGQMTRQHCCSTAHSITPLQGITTAWTHMFQDGGVPAYGVCPRELDKSGPGLERRGREI
ncbi:unnamed protein product [Arctogadus glacialis]